MISSDSEQSDTLEHGQFDRTGENDVDGAEGASALNPPKRELQHGDELIFPLMKSAMIQYVGDPEAPTELRFILLG